MDADNFLGRIVFSKAGRDMGKMFLVIDLINEDYVYISDGCLRSIEKPKKKKIKHLVFTEAYADEIRQMLLSDQKVSNSKISKFLQSQDIDKEV